MDIKSFFQEWDKHRHFKVSPKQFRQVLANCKFTLTNEEFDAIVAHYKEHSTGDVMYMKFLHDAFPEKYPLESDQKMTTTASKLGGSKGAKDESISPAKIPALDKVMTKIKNVV